MRKAETSNSLGLYLIFFGLLELGLACFFSIFIWISLLEYDFILPTVINLSLLGITLVYGIGQFFYRKKARVYLFGLMMRIFFIGSVFILYQIGFAPFVPDTSNYIWLIISIIVYIISAIYWYKKEASVWELTLEGLQKCGKLNVKKGYFKICEGFYSAAGKAFDSNKVGSLVGYTIALGFFILKLLDKYFEGVFMVLFLRFGLFFMSYVAGMAFGKFLLYTIEIRKLEKKLGIEFLTEFGEIKDKKRVKLNRKLKKPLEP
jgi:hypothetical protein